MEFTNAGNFEHITFEDITFPFNCFYMKNSNTLPHWHNHFEMVFSEKGCCTVYINGLSFLMSENQLMIIPPGSLHSIFPQGSCSYCAIVSGESLFEGLGADPHILEVLTPFMSIGLYPPVHLSEKDTAFKKCFSLLNELQKENAQKRNGYRARIKSQMIILFSVLYESLPQAFFKESKSPDSTRLIKLSLDYLRLHYSERITVNDMSMYCHLSIQHFCRLFKACTGKTFVEYLTLLRLEKARKILAGTDIPITQIPDLVGFCNSNYFCRLYKKYYGHPPSRDRINPPEDG